MCYNKFEQLVNLNKDGFSDFISVYELKKQDPQLSLQFLFPDHEFGSQYKVAMIYETESVLLWKPRRHERRMVLQDIDTFLLSVNSNSIIAADPNRVLYIKIYGRIKR